MLPGLPQFVSAKEDGQQRGNGQDKGKIEPARFFEHINTDKEKYQKPDEFSGDVQFKAIAKTDPDEKQIDADRQERQNQGLCHRCFFLPVVLNETFRYSRVPFGWSLTGAGLPYLGVSG
jgi:hypothetical protein